MTRTPATAVTPLRLWHWRRNPLRRRSDVVEGWILAAFWVLALACAVLAGVAAAQVSDSTSAARLSHLREVTAVVTDDSARSPAGSGKFDEGWARATVRWTDPDGTVHTDQTVVRAGDLAGAHVVIWADRAGHVVDAPVSGTAATVQAALTGALAAPLAGAAVWSVGRVVRTRLMRRRMAEWDAEWERTGPEGDFGGGTG
ncbi:hypothetical protein ACIRQQ_39770 [Streptomyces fuscichromogenes]|uniref:Rv1733c family protein n=1 Tax=Streptomyces fuscichromogenes TaxID=1324013 RepID=UPI00381B7840